MADRPDSATAAFIVTYSPTVFAGIAAELPPRMDTVRLYDTYLSTVPARARARLMRYELRDYQRDAAIEVLKRLATAGATGRRIGDRSSFALSAITGSGKTVIATAVIEALLFGSTDLDTDADPRVAFLWITDDPALNRQTRARMFDASELLAPDTLRRGRRVVPGRGPRARARSTSSTPRSCRRRAAWPRAARTPASSRSGTSLRDHDPRRRHRPRAWSSTRRTGA